MKEWKMKNKRKKKDRLISNKRIIKAKEGKNLKKEQKNERKKA